PLRVDVADLLHPGRIRVARLRRAHREEVLAPRFALVDQVAARVQRTERPVELEPRILRRRLHVSAAQRLPAHADRVDLVDEDDALAAPLPRELLRLAGEEAHDHRVYADERLREAGARDRD